MKIKCIGFIALAVLVISCSPQRRVSMRSNDFTVEKDGRKAYCDSLVAYKTLIMRKIDARVTLGEDQYNAKLSVYYIPDSVFFVSAVNSGFEIVRVGVYKDSTVYINRLEKLVYVVKSNEIGYPAPILFEDLEYLINKNMICSDYDGNLINDTSVSVNRSENNVVKEIEYYSCDLAVKRFEFFQKKTGEYVVGKKNTTNTIQIYSNYLLEHFIIEGSKGEIEYDSEINVDLSVNRRKYDIIYL